MDLSGSDRRKLREAILSAYPDQGDLEIMVREELGENLQAIAGGKTLNQVISNLITWAISRGKIKHLIIAAYAANEGNQKLKEFYQNIIQQSFLLNPAPVDSVGEFGPKIEWLGTTEDIQLESYLQPEPDLWDAIFFKRAVDNISSVCKIEIPSLKTRATGVLI
jgi:endonuclease G, mitochondrial